MRLLMMAWGWEQNFELPSLSAGVCFHDRWWVVTWLYCLSLPALEGDFLCQQTCYTSRGNSICLRGQENPEEFKLLQNGIGKVRSFIHSENYGIDSAIVNASKAAYLSKLIEKGLSEVRHFSSDKEQELIGASFDCGCGRRHSTRFSRMILEKGAHATLPALLYRLDIITHPLWVPCAKPS